MKKGVVFILMLLILFLGALLIYDFSDIPDDTLTSHDWYLLENNEFYVLNLKDNKFSFKNLNNDSEYMSVVNRFDKYFKKYFKIGKYFLF